MKYTYKGFTFDATQGAIRRHRKRSETYDPNQRNDIPKKQRHRIYKRDGYQCKKCGSKEWLTIDHIIPVSQGGPDREHNMQTLCRVCNQVKGSEIQAEYIKI